MTGQGAPLAPRTPWSFGFPDVLLHTTVQRRDAHPCYLAAKAGDAEAALTLAGDLIDTAAIETLRTKIADPATIALPVVADETTGFNAITTLTESRDARKIALRPTTRDLLWNTHGEELEALWKAQFGHGIDCLTDIEAQNLCRQPTVAAIENFLAQATVEARRRGLHPAPG